MLKREMYLSRIRGFYDSDLVKILVGIRRCGKSVILRQIMNEVKAPQIFLQANLMEAFLQLRFLSPDNSSSC